MKNWLIGIASVAILSAVADMILPDSHVSRYAKLCISLLLTTVIISPIMKFNINELVLELPELNDYTFEQTNFVDEEFSARFTDAIIADTGFDNISLSAKVGYDSIISVYIKGAQQWQKEEINSTLISKYNIPTEIVTYESD